MSIRLGIKSHSKVAPLGTSYFWDAPQVPENFKYPFIGSGADKFPMTFIMQVNCADVAPYDDEHLLPTRGFLYFFGDIDYFLGLSEVFDNGLSHWTGGIKVIYADVEASSLKRYNPFADSDTIPPYIIDFKKTYPNADGAKLLGTPYNDEVSQEFPSDWCLLFQLDSDEATHFNLRFFDEGLLYFMIERKCLLAHDFSQVSAYMTSL